MGKLSPSNLIDIAAYIEKKLSTDKEDLFKKMAGDYLYYLAGKREPIQFAGRDAWLDERRDVIEYFGRQAAGHAHFGDFFRSFENNAHGFD